MGLNQFDIRAPFGETDLIDSATGLSTIEITAANSVERFLTHLVATSDDIIDHDLQVWTRQGGSNLGIIGTVKIPAGAGASSAVPGVDVAAAIPFLAGGGLIPQGISLSVGVTVAVSAAMHLWVTNKGGTF